MKKRHILTILGLSLLLSSCGISTKTQTSNVISSSDETSVTATEVTTTIDETTTSEVTTTTDEVTTTADVATSDTEIVTVTEDAHVHEMSMHEAKEATCTEEGRILYYSCNTCGKYYTDSEGKNEVALSDTILPLKDHSYKDGICEVCGSVSEDYSAFTIYYGSNVLYEGITKNGEPLSYTLPSKDGFSTLGLYYDIALSKPYDNEVITKETSLYAGYHQNSTNTIAEVLAMSSGTAEVSGYAVAVNAKSYLLYDGTGYVLIYVGSNFTDIAVGDYVDLTGTITTYAGRVQLKYPAYSKYASTTYENPAAKTMSASEISSYYGLTSVDVSYVSIIGTLTISGSFYNVTVDGVTNGTIVSITYPSDTTYLTEMNGKEITFSAYITGVQNTKYLNVIVTEYQECEHEYVLTKTVDSTCSETGYYLYTCSKCGATSKTTIAMKEHTWSLTETVDATCTASGYELYTCSVCETTRKDVIPALGHDYEYGVCTRCHQEYVEPTGILQKTFGSDIIVYTTESENPYDIDLSVYGSNTSAIFYTPNITSVTTDPYASVSTDDFYASYTRATDYNDAYFRTKHNLMSGSITEEHPVTGATATTALKNGSYLRATDATYILSTTGAYLGYVPNTSGEEYIIYYGAAYITLNEEAAYLLAFGELPPNCDYSSSNTSSSVSAWGKYGRANNASYSGPSSNKYQYEPSLANSYSWTETDYGCMTPFNPVDYNSNDLDEMKSYNSLVPVYNSGTAIERGVCRFIFVSDSSVKDINLRHVWYTYNHYDDFQAYLNYDGGWTERFGFVSAGHTYCSNTSTYNSSHSGEEPTQYMGHTEALFSEIKSLL